MKMAFFSLLAFLPPPLILSTALFQPQLYPASTECPIFGFKVFLKQILVSRKIIMALKL